MLKAVGRLVRLSPGNLGNERARARCRILGRLGLLGVSLLFQKEQIRTCSLMGSAVVEAADGLMDVGHEDLGDEVSGVTSRTIASPPDMGSVWGKNVKKSQE